MAGSLIHTRTGERWRIVARDANIARHETNSGGALLALDAGTLALAPDYGYGPNALVAVRSATGAIERIPRDELFKRLTEKDETRRVSLIPDDEQQALASERHRASIAEAQEAAERPGGGGVLAGGRPQPTEPERIAGTIAAPAAGAALGALRVSTLGLSDLAIRAIGGPEAAEALRVAAGEEAPPEGAGATAGDVAGNVFRVASGQPATPRYGSPGYINPSVQSAATVGGELAGVALPGAGAGARALGEAGARAVPGAGALPSLTRPLVRGAPIGAELGATQGVSETAMRAATPDPARAAQEIIAHAGVGALVGAIAEPVFAGAGRILRGFGTRTEAFGGRQLPTIAAPRLREYQNEVYDYVSLSGQVGPEALGTRARQIGITALGRVAPEAGRREVPSSTLRTMEAQANRAREAAGADIEAVIQEAGEATRRVEQFAPQAAATTRALPGAVAPGTVVATFEDLGRSAARQIEIAMADAMAAIEPHVQPNVSPATRSFIADYFDRLRSALTADSSLRNVHRLRTDIDRLAYGTSPPEVDPDTVRGILRAFRREYDARLRDAIARASEEGGDPRLLARFVDANDRWNVARMFGGFGGREAAQVEITPILQVRPSGRGGVTQGFTGTIMPPVRARIGAVVDTIARAGILGDPAARAATAGETRRSALRDIIHGTSRGVRVARVPASAEAVDAARSHLDMYTTDRDGWTAAMMRSLDDVLTRDPALASQMAQTIARGMDYLAARVPPATRSGGPPHRRDREAFLASYETVMQPSIVLDRLRDGTLSQDHVRTLRAVYPDYYEALMADVHAETDHRLDIPADLRRVLRLLAGEPEGAGLPGSRLRLLQGRFGGAPAPQVGQSQPSSLPSRAMTVGQQIGGSR